MTFLIAVVVCAVILFVTIVRLTALALGGEKPAGRHARRDPFAGPQDTRGPQDAVTLDGAAERAADEFITELRGEEEAETAAVPVPVLTAPLPAVDVLEPLEPLPSSPLERRTRSEVPVITAPWEPPVSRGDLSTLRDALRAWTPRPAVPQEAAPEPDPEPGPVPDWLTTSAVDAFAPVLELGDVGRYVDRVFAPAEEATRAAVAAHLGSDEGMADFAGVSVAGLPDDGWDLSAPVALNGQHRGAGNEALS